MAQSREDSVYLAKLAEQAERYEGTWLACMFPLRRVAHATLCGACRDG